MSSGSCRSCRGWSTPSWSTCGEWRPGGSEACPSTGQCVVCSWLCCLVVLRAVFMVYDVCMQCDMCLWYVACVNGVWCVCILCGGESPQGAPLRLCSLMFCSWSLRHNRGVTDTLGNSNVLRGRTEEFTFLCIQISLPLNSIFHDIWEVSLCVSVQ